MQLVSFAAIPVGVTPPDPPQNVYAMAGSSTEAVGHAAGDGNTGSPDTFDVTVDAGRSMLSLPCADAVVDVVPVSTSTRGSSARVVGFTSSKVAGVPRLADRFTLIVAKALLSG